MVRTVKVRLELDRSDYRQGLRDAATDTRDFDGEVRAAGKDLGAMGVEVKSAGSDVQSMGREVDSAAKKTTTLGQETRKTRDETEKFREETRKTREETSGLGGDSDKTKTKIVELAKEIGNAKASLAAMGEEFRKTGQIDMSKFNEVSRTLRDLQRAKTAIEKLIPGGNGSSSSKSGGGILDFALDEFIPKITKAAGSAMANGLESGTQSAGKAIASNPWIAAAVAAAITLGVPAIGGALTAAVGGGAIAGGILLAAKDSRTKAAWSEFGTSAKEELTGAASVFVDPLVHGAQTFGTTLGHIMPSIRADFDHLAPVTDRLFAGAAGFVERMMPGVDALVHEAGPTLTMVANELPRLGGSISQMFKDIAAGGEGGKEALHDMLILIEATTFSVGKTVEGLEKWYQAERSLGQLLSGDAYGAAKNWQNLIYGINDASRQAAGPAVMQAWKIATAAIGQTGSAAAFSADQLKTLSGQISATVLTADTLAGQMTDRAMASMLGMGHATLGVAESLTSLKDTFDQDGLAVDKHTGLVAMNTQAGQHNREAVLSAIEANLRMYDAQIASGVSAEQAATKYGQNTQALHDQLRQAGLTEGQVHDLIGEYGNVPQKVNTDIALHGLQDAITGLDNLLRQLNGLTYTRTINIDQVTRHIDVGSKPGEVYNDGFGRAKGGIDTYAHGGIQSFARAGIYAASGPGLVKFAERETGGEAYIPRLGISQDRAMSLASEVGKWHDFSVVPNHAPNYAAFAGSRPVAGGGGTATVVHEHRVIVQEPSGRRLAELVITDGNRGGPLRQYIRNVASSS